MDTNIRHSGSESYDQGFVSIAKPQTTQGLLLLKHALRRTCADSASLDAMESASRHKANQIKKKKKRSELAVALHLPTVQHAILGNRSSLALLARLRKAC